MTEPASYAALIPALDCAATIGEVVHGARAHVERVLVVDDGSTDATAAEARDAGAEVFSHGGNFGKGAALLSGLRYLEERGHSHAVTLDGDGQHFPSDIPVLLEESKKFPAALVLGNRVIDDEVASINRFGNRFANLWVWLASGRDLGDTQCGMRVYPIIRTLELHPVGMHFDFETEVLIRAVRASLDVRGVPVRVYYPPPEQRTSHYDKVWDTARIVEMVLGLMIGWR